MTKSTSYTCDLCEKPIAKEPVIGISVQVLNASGSGPMYMFDMHRHCANAVVNDIRFGHIARNHQLLDD